MPQVGIWRVCICFHLNRNSIYSMFPKDDEKEMVEQNFLDSEDFHKVKGQFRV